MQDVKRGLVEEERVDEIECKVFIKSSHSNLLGIRGGAGAQGRPLLRGGGMQEKKTAEFHFEACRVTNLQRRWANFQQIIQKEEEERSSL